MNINESNYAPGFVAGFVAAHSFFCLVDEDTLIPVAGFATANEPVTVERFVSDTTEEVFNIFDSVSRLKYDDTVVGAVALRGRIEDEDTEALIVKGYANFSGESFVDHFVVGIPYTAVDSPQGFSIGEPRLLEVTENIHVNGDAAKIQEAFFEGVNSHHEGSQVWVNHKMGS